MHVTIEIDKKKKKPSDIGLLLLPICSFTERFLVNVLGQTVFSVVRYKTLSISPQEFKYCFVNLWYPKKIHNYIDV